MSNLTLVGHFSTALALGWVVWLLWCAWQVHWYRRARPVTPPVIVQVPPEPAAPKPDRASALRAPDPMIRSMSAAPTPRAATQPVVDRAAVEPPSIEPATGPPEAPASDAAAPERSDVKRSD